MSIKINSMLDTTNNSWEVSLGGELDVSTADELKKEFEKRKIRDKLKVEYCLENNIPLLIIYPDDNIREKINNFMEDLV